ncbi:MAG: lipopolysaccharide transport periplasmic protein LptA [Gammaproteobacteria bacterium]
MATSCRSLLALLCLGCVSAAGFAADGLQLPESAQADRALPIELDAAWSELDRRNNRLVFRNLHITQGRLAISADEATADPADFENSTWVFTGNVQIENAGLKAWCDRAEMTFSNNTLLRTTLRGKPARFMQPRPGGGATEGRGELLEYDLAARTIQMTSNALLSDGSNEITGSNIAYDLGREVVTASNNGSGQVRMKFTPRNKPDPQDQGTAPAPNPPDQTTD